MASLPSRPSPKVVRLPLGPRPPRELSLVVEKNSAARYANSPLLHDGDHRPSHAPGLLTSWKDICHYLQRGVRTTQRWERLLGLPVHRIGKGKRAPVFAFEHELDAWLHKKDGASLQDGAKLSCGSESALNSQQKWLKRFIQELRLGALQLEQNLSSEGFEQDAHTSETLLALLKLVNAAVARQQSAPPPSSGGLNEDLARKSSQSAACQRVLNHSPRQFRRPHIKLLTLDSELQCPLDRP
jgi:hypothetical protein